MSYDHDKTAGDLRKKMGSISGYLINLKQPRPLLVLSPTRVREGLIQIHKIMRVLLVTTPTKAEDLQYKKKILFMIRLKHLPLLLLFSAASCENNDSSASKKVNRAINAVADTNYVRTGFYFLTDTLNGIKMKLENSGEFFHVDKSAFASVDHIEDNDIQKNKTEQGISKSLYLKFDSEGTKDLAEGTGNPLHSKIAVVIANKLLYVVENNAKIKTGVMNIYVGNYSDQEIQEMQNAIANKK